MARNRMIKKEFWTDEKVIECSVTARLLFIGTWNFADDAGRLQFSARSIKAQIFPADDFSSDTMNGLVTELERNGLITLYDVDNKQYIQINGWHNQVINKPQPSKIPAPTDENTNHSVTDTGTVTPKGKERKGKERERAGARVPDSDSDSLDVESDDDPAPESPNPVVRFITMLDEEIIRIFGIEQARPWPAPNDFGSAEEINQIAVLNDLTDDAVRFVIGSVLDRKKAKDGKPASLAYFVNAVREHAAKPKAEVVELMPSGHPKKAKPHPIPGRQAFHHVTGEPIDVEGEAALALTHGPLSVKWGWFTQERYAELVAYINELLGNEITGVATDGTTNDTSTG